LPWCADGRAADALPQSRAGPQARPDAAARSRQQEPLESGFEIDAHPDSEQPFTRCPVCEADNSKFAVRCINCQTALDTEQVREWNQRLWAERQKQRALEPVRAPLPPPGPDVQRQLGEMIARQVGQHEREKWSFSIDFRTGDTRPLGMKLLDSIPDANLRFGVAMGLVATFFASGIVAYVAEAHPPLQFASIGVALVLLFLFLPGGRRSSRWWDDD
jgi:hypothetical protein